MIRKQLTIVACVLLPFLCLDLKSQSAKLIGTGTLNGGTIYSVNVDGTNPQTLFDMRFGVNDLWQQPRLIEKDGKLYGVTTQGVSSRYGVIFSIEPDGSNFTEIFQFDGANGHQPNAGLVDVNGMFYGTTWSGGAFNGGIVFKINYDGTNFEIINEFQDSTVDGYRPIGDLLEYSGALWGVTAGGGSSYAGTIFTIDLLDDSYSKILDFDRALAFNPSGSLIEINGDLWGMTYWGSSNNSGLLYKISLADTTFNAIHSFSSGSSPLGSLLWENDYIWGPSRKGGTTGGGYIFRIKTDGTMYEVVHDHTIDRLSPEGGFIVNNGKIWGLANEYSGDIRGGIISIDNDGTNHTTHHSFSFNSSYHLGVNPSGTLLDFNGSFYGMTFDGGTGGTGTIFKIGSDGVNYNVIYNFNETNGHEPLGSPIEAGGKIFGITNMGGVGFGVIYSMGVDGNNYSKIHKFSNSGYYFPRDGGLIVKDGKLYGSTGFGGISNKGGIYRINQDGSDFTVVRDFLSNENDAKITTVIGDKLWGTLQGDFYKGAIFNINLDGSGFQKIFDFNGTNGDFIVGKFIEHLGKIWGVTRFGGQYSSGVIFRINADGNNFEIVHHFEGASGRNPSDGLIEFEGELWGTTFRGGAENRGTIYKIDSEGTYQMVHSFTSETGVWPQATLVNNFGTLYGVTSSSGGGVGSLYRIDPISLEFTKISIFSSEFGGRPQSTPIIIKDYQEITFDHISDMTYGDDPFTLSASSNSTNPIFFISSDESIISIINNQATIVGTGEVTLYAFQEEYENYHTAQVEQTILISKAPLEATAIDASMVYGGEVPALDISYAGFLNGDSETDITEPVISTLANSTSDVGNYMITLSEGSALNYELSLVSGDLTITKAPLEAKAIDVSMVYGGEVPALDISYAGFLNGDSETDITEPVISTLANSTSDVGNYMITLSEGSALNYELSLVSGDLTITKAPLEAKATDVSMVYGGEVSALDINYTGFLNGDGEVDITEPVISTLANSTSDVGNYVISLSEGSAVNYELTLVSGDITITEAPLEAKAIDVSMVYGGEVPALDINYTGFLNGDSEVDITEPVISTLANSTSDVGNYVISLSEGSAVNYELTLVSGDITITKAPLEAKAIDVSMVYGGEVPALDINYTGFLNGDSESDINEPGISTLATFSSNAGAYEISLAGGVSINYEFTLIPGTLMIGKAPLEATAIDASMVYGEEVPALAISYSGFLNGDSEADITEPIITTLANSGSDAGEYEILLTEGSSNNYQLILKNGIFTINKAPQSIIFDEPGAITSEQTEIIFSVESTSSLPVDLESSDENILIIDGNTGLVVGHGSVAITANQGGDNNFLSADPVQRTVFIEEILGLEEDIIISIYPNPFSEEFLLRFDNINLRISELSVFDSNGKLIPIIISTEKSGISIRVVDPAPGVYFLSYNVDNKNQIHRLIKK